MSHTGFEFCVVSGGVVGSSLPYSRTAIHMSMMVEAPEGFVTTQNWEKGSECVLFLLIFFYRC